MFQQFVDSLSINTHTYTKYVVEGCFAYCEFGSGMAADMAYSIDLSGTVYKNENILIHYAIDSATLSQSIWHAVIIRNIPADITIDNLVAMARELGIRVRYALPIIEVKSNNIIR